MSISTCVLGLLAALVPGSGAAKEEGCRFSAEWDSGAIRLELRLELAISLCSAGEESAERAVIPYRQWEPWTAPALPADREAGQEEALRDWKSAAPSLDEPWSDWQAMDKTSRRDDR